MTGTPSSERVSTKQKRIAELAKKIKGEGLTSLSHHIDEEWMKEAYNRTRKDGAVGVDGQTSKDYAANLEENLRSLLNRAKSGDGYKAPPGRRAYIPKNDGKSRRAISVPSFEDKILQRAVTMVLEPVYEEEFLESSYGFRPGRSPHQAIEKLWQTMTPWNGCWVLEADIETYFDRVQHKKLQEILSNRVRDGVIKRLIGKWLKAGVMEKGVVYHPESGTPQGGVISPLLSNVYLHDVLDKWFEEQVKPRLQSEAILIRFADDFVILFRRKEDAEQVLKVLPKRFAKARPKPSSNQNEVDQFLQTTSNWWNEGTKGKTGEL